MFSVSICKTTMLHIADNRNKKKLSSQVVNIDGKIIGFILLESFLQPCIIVGHVVNFIYNILLYNIGIERYSLSSTLEVNNLIEGCKEFLQAQVKDQYCIPHTQEITQSLVPHLIFLKRLVDCIYRSRCHKKCRAF